MSDVTAVFHKRWQTSDTDVAVLPTLTSPPPSSMIWGALLLCMLLSMGPHGAAANDAQSLVHSHSYTAASVSTTLDCSSALWAENGINCTCTAKSSCSGNLYTSLELLNSSKFVPSVCPNSHSCHMYLYVPEADMSFDGVQVMCNVT